MMRSFRGGRAALALLAALLLVFLPGTGRQPDSVSDTGLQRTIQTEAAGSAQGTAGKGQAEQGLRVDFLDVGQGDAAVVRCGSQALMIDGGNAKESSFIYSWLQNQGLSYLDYMVATHPDADHVGGLSGALNYAAVGTVYCSVTDSDTKTFRSFRKYVEQQGKSITVPSAGTVFPLGDARVQVLGPLTAGSSDNNNSLVLKVSYGQTSFLFTGDAEREEEQDLLNSGADLQSTVLKVGHHGSASSTSYQFLRTVNPQYAVISVGAGNSYGHPTAEVLSRLRDAGVKTYRTDLQGTVTAVSDGTNAAFSVEKNPDADTLSGAGAGQLSGQNGQSQKKGSTYVLNTNTKKFHLPSCSSVNQMKAKNKKTVTESRDQLISEGYSPCKRCNP